jgi:glycopeptide antibiotics resistance protein
MLSTFIIENFLLVRIALIVGALVCVALAAVLGWIGRTGQRIATGIAAVAAVAVVLLTLTPDKYAIPAVTCSFDPSFFYNDEFNIVLFLLPVLFAVVATRRPVVVLAGGIGLSAIIEVVQSLTLALGRRCDVGDWLANSTGTAIGVLIAVVVMAVIRRVKRRRSH